MNIKINKDTIFNYNRSPIIISEISSNHGGSKQRFLNLIEKSFDNGADLVKIQTYEPKDITFKNLNSKIKEGLWKNKNLWELYTKAHTPFEWHYDAFKIAKKKNRNVFAWTIMSILTNPLIIWVIINILSDNNAGKKKRRRK